MASGKIHSRVAFGMLIVVPLGIRIWFPQVPLGNVIVGLLCGFFIDPDLDQEAHTVSEYRFYRIPGIGPFIVILWSWIWYGYAQLVPHRNPISHWPILGTAGRVAYMAVALLLFSLIVGACRWNPLINWKELWKFFWPWGFAAWALQDGLHWCFDYIPFLNRQQKPIDND